MEAKHTPGPWEISKMAVPVWGSNGEEVDVKTGIYSPNSSKPIASVGGLNDKRTVANSRLIAAAPDLLATLKKITYAPWFLDEVLKSPEKYDVWRTMVTIINKTEGRG